MEHLAWTHSQPRWLSIIIIIMHIAHIMWNEHLQENARMQMHNPILQFTITVNLLNFTKAFSLTAHNIYSVQ